MSFIKFLNETNDKLDSESKKILAAFKKHLKEKSKSKGESVIEAIPCVTKDRPALAIFYWLGGTTNMAGFDDWDSDYISNGDTKLSFEPKFSRKTKKKKPGASSFDQVKELSVEVKVFFLKSNISIESLKIILKNEGYKFSENGNTLNIDSDDIKSKSDIEKLLKKYKNVKFEWGGYYADVDNKHYVESIDIVIS